MSFQTLFLRTLKRCMSINVSTFFDLGNVRWDKNCNEEEKSNFIIIQFFKVLFTYEYTLFSIVILECRPYEKPFGN